MLELAKNYRITFYDQRGSGRSLGGKIDEETINIAAFIEDIEALRDHLELEKFTLIGHSWGGLLAMEYSIKYSKNLHNLVLLNPAPITYEEQLNFTNDLPKRLEPIKQKVKGLFNYESFAKLNAREIEAFYKNLFSVYFHDSRNVNKLSLKFTELSAKSGMKIYEKIDKTSWLQENYDLRPVLSKLNIPTLIISGDSDIVSLSAIGEINENILGSELIVLEKCGHFPFVECKKQFFYEIENFLSPYSNR